MFIFVYISGRVFCPVNLINSMKKLIIIALLLAGTGSAFAQSNKNTTSATQPSGRSISEQRATNETERMTMMLDLSKDQQTKVKAINLAAMTEMEHLRGKSPEASRDKARGIMEQRDKQYKTVLTEAQYKKYEELAGRRR